MKRTFIATWLSLILLFGVLPIHAAEAASNALIWQGYDDDGKLKGINLTTFKDKKSTTKSLYNEDIRSLKVVGNWIYFITEEADNYYSGKIGKIKTNGTGLTYLTKAASFVNLDVVGNTIYFVETDKNYNPSFGSMKTDGTKTQSILSKSPFTYFMINKGSIYYIGHNNGLLYSMKLDGTGAKALSSERVNEINVFKNILFFTQDWKNEITSQGIFAELDGSKKKTFHSNGIVIPLGYISNKLYFEERFVDKNGYTLSNISVVNRDGTKKTRLAPLLSVETNNRFLGQAGNTFVFLTPAGSVYRIGLDGKIIK